MSPDLALAEAETEEPGRSVRRLSRGLSLERFDDPRLLAAGKVNLIVLDELAEALGADWEGRRHGVYQQVDEVLERGLGGQGRFLRISTTDFIVCQPTLTRFAAQAACARHLREIHERVLGRARPVDLGVHTVTSITAEGVEAVRCDLTIARAREDEAARPEPVDEDEESIDDDRWAPFVASDGRRVRISCVLEPIIELKTYRRIGFRLARRVLQVETGDELSPAAIASLSSGDILRIDLASVSRGLDRLRAQNANGMALSVIVPVSFYSLSSQRGRAEIMTAFKEARGLVQKGVICEVGDIEGVARGALASAIDVIKPFCLFVVGRRLAEGSGGLRALKGVGLQALSFECPPGMADAELIGWGKSTLGPARRIARSVLVYHADSGRAAGMAAMMGATHATLRAELQPD